MASCASSGKGEDQTFDDSGTADGTMGDDGGDTGSVTTGDSGGGSQCDADTMTSNANCGACGHACGKGQTCSCGSCISACTGTMTACCGACVDVSSDPNNCGTCGSACVPSSNGTVAAIPHCTGGACSFTCPTDAGIEGGGPIVTCGEDSGTPGCFDLTSSAAACGSCGHACPSGGVCSQGICCNANEGVCGGVCTALNTVSNCGTCGHTCGTGAMCTNGKCVGYSTTNPSIPFIDACTLPGAKTVLTNKSSFAYTSTPIQLPITFNFFGTAETELWIGSQGGLGFGAPATFPPPAQFQDCSMPDPFSNFASVLVFADQNLATGALGVCYAATTAGDAGDAGGGPAFVVTWKQATEALDPSASLTFSVVLTQGTDTIDFQYLNSGPDGGLDSTAAGGNATVGLIQGSPATGAVSVQCDGPFITSTPYDVRLTP